MAGHTSKGARTRFRPPGQPGPEHADAPGTLTERDASMTQVARIGPPDAWEICRRIEAARRPSRAASTPDYLEDFRAGFQDLLEHLETGLTADLEARGPSVDLMHDWSLVLAQAQDFLAALAAEIARAER